MRAVLDRRFISPLIVAVLAGPLPAFAQSEPGAPRSARTSTAAVLEDLVGLSPPVPPAGEDHPAWRLYHLAFEALAQSKRADATTLLRQLVSTHPKHPLAPRAAGILKSLDDGNLSAAYNAAQETMLSTGRDRSPTAFARAELVVAQTLHGIALGAEICIVAECDDTRAIGASIVVGGGLGLTLSLLLTGDGITPGHTAALDTGTLWGASTGFLLSGVINSSEERVIPGAMMAGQLLGLGVGHLAWRFTHASSGDVSLASSTGFWAGFLATMTTLSVVNGDPGETEPLFGVILGTSVAGLIGGAFLADAFPMSRGRVLVIDGGGLVGGLAGLGTALIIRAEDAAPYFILTGLGAAGGLLLTTALTRDWDIDVGREASLMIVPTDGGAMVSFGTRW